MVNIVNSVTTTSDHSSRNLQPHELAQILTALDENTPKGLLGLIFIRFLLVVPTRGGAELRNIKWSQFEHSTSERGESVWIYKGPSSLKNYKLRNVGDKKSATFIGDHIIYNVDTADGKSNLYTLLCKYDQVRPKDEPDFFLRAKDATPSDNSPWFYKIPIGQKELSKMAKTLAINSGMLVLV